MSRPRAYTVEEERAAFLDAVRSLAAYWSTQHASHTPQRMCDGLAFSILTLIDGLSGESPGMNLAIAVHPDDEAYCKARGENWHQNGLVINDTGDYLHDDYYDGSAR